MECDPSGREAQPPGRLTRSLSFNGYQAFASLRLAAIWGANTPHNRGTPIISKIKYFLYFQRTILYGFFNKIIKKSIELANIRLID